MWVGIGVGIGRNRFATGIFNDYALRVNADGGITEAGQCVDAGATPLLQTASLLLIPSGYKGGKLYSEIPTNGNGDFTWTRASDGTRTNASGVIQRVPWNLASYSEEFGNAYWTKGNFSTVSSNVTTAPNGTSTADKHVSANSTAAFALGNFSFSIINATTYTFSAYVKKSEVRYVQFRTNIAGNLFCNFDLDLGIEGTPSAGLTQTITSVGDGWYRVSITATANATATSGFAINMVTSLTAPLAVAYPGNGVDGYFVWGAQIVEGSSAETYLPTTDRLGFPRLSYMYGSCPSALLEPQRTNLVLYSAQFDDATWTKSSASITANSVTSPDGTTNADTFESTTNTTTEVIVSQNISSTSGTNYAFTFYVKPNNQNFVFLCINGQGTTNHFITAVFDLSDGTVGQTAVGTTSGTIVSTSIQQASNGFYRLTLVGSINFTNLRARIGLATAKTGNSISTTGSVTISNSLGKSVYIYGAQVEAGAYPTTYIPTTSATATRVADSFSRNNIYTNGLITSSGGTWFVEFRVGSTSRDNGTTIRIGDVLNAFNIAAGLSGTGYGFILNKTIGATGTNIYFSFLGISAFVKLAIKWNGTTADVFANGTKVVSATAFTPTNLPDLTGSFGTPIFIKQMALFSTPLSDTNCTTLTT